MYQHTTNIMAEQDEGDIRVIKMTLNQFCNDKTREQFVATVKPLIITMNVVMAETYTFANFHIIRCLSDPTFDSTSSRSLTVISTSAAS